MFGSTRALTGSQADSCCSGMTPVDSYVPFTQVHDSTSECRYLVVPMPPPGCDPRAEEWDIPRLAALVTRDSCIGVGLPRAP
jgi:hypothetical protein